MTGAVIAYFIRFSATCVIPVLVFYLHAEHAADAAGISFSGVCPRVRVFSRQKEKYVSEIDVTW